MEWTTEQPASSGVYFAYNSKDGVEIAEVAEKYQSPFDEPKPVEFECWPIRDDRAFGLKHYTHWLGPLEVPAPPTG